MVAPPEIRTGLTTVPPRVAAQNTQRAETRHTGWRERIDSGVYRAHRIGCPASGDRRPGRRCGCSFQILVPGDLSGRTRMLTIRGTITEARAAK